MASAAPAVRPCRASEPSLQSRSTAQIARDLDDLIRMGFIEKFKDEHNVTRYRPLLVAKRSFV
jgi:hypothetical protein